MNKICLEIILDNLMSIRAFFHREGTYFENDRLTILRITEESMDMINDSGCQLERLSQKAYDRTKHNYEEGE